jgi:hypothetical protein
MLSDLRMRKRSSLGLVRRLRHGARVASGDCRHPSAMGKTRKRSGGVRVSDVFFSTEPLKVLIYSAHRSNNVYAVTEPLAS